MTTPGQSLKADRAAALRQLAIDYQREGKLSLAEQHYREALKLEPDHVVTLSKLGNLLADRGAFEECLPYFQRASELRPNMANVAVNLGFALTRLGRLAEAEPVLRRAVELAPNSAAAHLNLAAMYLAAGNYPAGFAENEWRLNSGYQRPFSPRWPVWDGRPGAGRSIVLISEQGLGDTMQFLRYAGLLRAQGWQRILVECPRAMHALISCAQDVDAVCVADDPTFEADACAPLLSLPLLLATTRDNIPAHVPYVQANADLIEHWRGKLAEHPGFKVGIVWQGNPAHKADAARSIPLTAFEALAQVPRVQLINLQNGFGAEQLAPLAHRWNILDYGDQLDGASGAFMDTAAIMCSLDLVITSDTSAAHLAGAMGIPVWAALAHVPDWRWSLEPTTSPWYPSMRLFRQPRWHDWASVFAQMAAEVRRLVSGV